MTAFLPPNLLALFAPRDPLPFMPVPERPSHCTKQPYTGVSHFLHGFEDPKDTPPPTRVETKDERRDRKTKERAEAIAYKLEQDLALWDPHNDAQATTDPFKTLFVARVNFDTSESKLRREFEVYGPIRTIRVIQGVDNGKPRGYAFIEYEHERDMHSAYKHADGKKIDSRRVLVDVERARTVKGWRPRRLGGGLGSTRKGGPDVNSRFSGRDDGANRSRSRSQDRRRPRRSRSRERGGERRNKSRERKRRSRSPRRRDDEERPVRKRRSRSRDRKRSRSRDRKRPRRSRSGDRRGRSGDRDEDGSGDGEGQAFGNGQSAPPIGVHGAPPSVSDFGDY